jgi:hypothetical protein
MNKKRRFLMKKKQNNTIFAGIWIVLVMAAICGFTACPTSTGGGGKVAVTGVTLDKTALELEQGDIEELTATVQPADATNKAVSWSSSNQSVATVHDGVVTAVAAGTATITVTTQNGGKTATCAVTVQETVTEVPQPETFAITVADITDGAPVITGPTISISGANKTATITLSNPGQYSSIQWHITGTGIIERGNSITLDSANAAYNSLGEHLITVEVVKDGVPYNTTVTFTVAN